MTGAAAVTAGEVSGVLRNCGVPEERVEAFQTACGQSFGEGALTPANLIDAKHFAVKTADATIQVDPERSYLVEAGSSTTALPAGSGGRECGGQRSGGPGLPPPKTAERLHKQGGREYAEADPDRRRHRHR